MSRRSNHCKSQKEASNQNPMTGQVAQETLTKEAPTERSSDRSHSDNSHSSRSGEDCEPMDASREASLDRAAQSSGSDTMDGVSPRPSRPQSPLPNHDNMDSGPHYCLKIFVYEMTHKGR